MQPHLITIVACLYTVEFSSIAVAQESSNQISASLELVVDAAARLETTYCDVDLERSFQGAIDGINAMPKRSAEPPIRLSRPRLSDFARVYDELLESAADRREIERAAINGMIHVYDSAGEWQPTDEVRRTLATGSILVQLEGSGDKPLVVGAFDEGPAQRAGIRVGDRLVEIDGQPTAGLRLHEVVQRLQGEIGSDVTIVVERNSAPLAFTMQRALNARRPVQWRIEGSVGIITVEQFQQGRSAMAVRDAIRDIRREVLQPSGYISICVTTLAASCFK